ncbi:glycosyltransferase family 2 protein [Naumannella halotolerans]|uniref:glycosyltransferase family 2 protein n=1 Tax=Naumannella halotolerans TaxID=993414 RepID=UPI00370D56C0
MLNAVDDSRFPQWHSNDFLLRLRNGERIRPEQDASVSSTAQPSPSAAASDPVFDLLGGDSAWHEHLAVLRSPALSTDRVRSFGARHGSVWALDLLAERYTRGAHDWGSLRAVAVRFADAPRAFEPTLDRLALKELWSISEVLHESGADPTAERALLSFISARVLDGAEFAVPLRELLLERLIDADLPTPARNLVGGLVGNSWRKHALTVELEHPRFGGSYDDLLLALNPSYHRYGLERLRFDGPGECAFHRLTTEVRQTVREGPLVSVILILREPDDSALSAVRSILSQTHRELELIVVDDGSPEEYGPMLDQVAALDARINMVRGTGHAGPYVRRNEALRLAAGDYITFQDPFGWSHPARIEIQVRDLQLNPGKLGNVVRAARTTADFSLVGARGARLVLSESSLLFSRDPVLTTVGHFDAVNRGAATEFRNRLEAATGAKIGFVGPDLPLEFVLASRPGDSQNDFEYGRWVDSEWLAYREAASRFHGHIRSGNHSAFLPYPQEQRAFPAPPSWVGTTPTEHTADVLLVLDAQGSRGRQAFLDAVADELHTAVAGGLRVALLHAESVTGADRPGPIDTGLQELVDSNQIVRVFDADVVDATVVVVRHAGAAQGHAKGRRPVNAGRVVLVEDHAAGDVPGQTFARDDVDATVTEWFGIPPIRLLAAPLPKRPTVRSVVARDGDIQVTLQATDATQITAVRIGDGKQSLDLSVTMNKLGYVVAVGALDLLPAGELLVSVVRGTEEGATFQGCPVAPESVIATPGDRLLVASSHGLRLLSAEGTDLQLGAHEFTERHLSARISGTRIFHDELELTVESRPGVTVTAVHLLRVIGGRVRRRVFELDQIKDGRQRGMREMEALLDQRWRTYAAYQTPIGPVLAPIRFDAETSVADSAQYQVRRLHRGGVDVLHLVERPAETLPDRTPMLSVIMPVFNVAPYLDTAIQSVLMQDFQDFELIIIDDASTDNGRQVIDMHQSIDPRIRVIGLDHNTLGGAGVPSNLGIRAARGKYVAFVDSDDWVTKTAFAKLVQLAEDNDTELVIGNFRTFDEKNRTFSEAYDSDRWRDIPLGEVIAAWSHPDLLRLSPVPWRKLYRRDFVQEHQVLYPEGDYFYEDNPLHWHVLARAERVITCNEIVSYHRLAREGQTMGAHEYKLAAIASHANTTLNSLIATDSDHRAILFEQFIDYVSRQRWIVRRQTQEAAAQMIKSRLADIYDRARQAEPEAIVPPATVNHFAGYRDAYPDMDLTVVIPVYNSADLLRSTIDSVLQLEGLEYDVLLIDDGSTDKSLKVMRDYEQRFDNVHVFEQKNRGAGRARNAVIPLCTGRYTYFLDADDTVDARALREAVQRADQDDADLLFMQYRIEYVERKRTRGMFDADVEIWRQLPTAGDNLEKQCLLTGLINYPWNRIIRTDLLHDANIFFGPTIVHNDVLFHWHSILSATKISHIDIAVCTHRKFTERAQVTNIDDERRMAVLEALRGTHERISGLDSYLVTQEQWIAFALHLLDWARDLIPPRLRTIYRQRSTALAKALTGNN